MKILWQEPKNRSNIVILIALASLIQFFITLYASTHFPINNYQIFLFISIGVIFLLTGLEILFADLIHSFRLHLRQKKPIKRKIGLKKVSEIYSIYTGAGIILGLFILVYFIFSFYIIDPLAFIELPIYAKFVLAEILSGMVIVIAVLIFNSALPQK
jgi:hypothetical protein